MHQLGPKDLQLNFVVKARAQQEGKTENDILKELGISVAVKPSERWPKQKTSKKATRRKSRKSKSRDSEKKVSENMTCM